MRYNYFNSNLNLSDGLIMAVFLNVQAVHCFGYMKQKIKIKYKKGAVKAHRTAAQFLVNAPRVLVHYVHKTEQKSWPTPLPLFNNFAALAAPNPPFLSMWPTPPSQLVPITPSPGHRLQCQGLHFVTVLGLAPIQTLNY